MSSDDIFANISYLLPTVIDNSLYNTLLYRQKMIDTIIFAFIIKSNKTVTIKRLSESISFPLYVLTFSIKVCLFFINHNIIDLNFSAAIRGKHECWCNVKSIVVRGNC